MNVLIVESNADLARIWARHLERQGVQVEIASGQSDAIESLQRAEPNLIVLGLLLDEGSALAVSDYAQYRHPETKVIITSNSRFFSDGSIFQHAANACAFLPNEVEPDDLTAMVEHFGQTSR
ncbi:response regulator transcription factor [Celeribacter litoreus]|uniref:response regulator transcription factor n=1 Tax=Celeribacter litoreus TaxID=2876714 RepID=UPI001CCF2C68|nr:response regulator [Celeribacter litoreus]MCA0042337.1 response regulator [Celeribacter litoreus]